jgi:heme exporter protein A
MPQRTIYVSPRALGEVPRPPAVETHDLARLFAGHAAIAGVSLRIEGGRMVALYGPNGAGKTTLLRLLATAVRPSFGRALVDGIDVTAFPDAVRGRIAFLSHAGGLYDDLTATENLRFAGTLLGVRSERLTNVVESALARVGLVADADRRVRGFSAGMRRRLALARLLLVRPPVLLLDEPYASIDAGGADLVDALLVEWRQAGASILVASHAEERLTPLVDGSVRLAGGVVAEVRGGGVEMLAPAIVPAGAEDRAGVGAGVAPLAEAPR